MISASLLSLMYNYPKCCANQLNLAVFQDLESALGEVEFRDGIPDVKFSRVSWVTNTS